MWTGIRMTLRRIFTQNIWKSAGIGTAACVMAFMPFIWAVRSEFFDSATQPIPHLEILIRCLDQWLLSSLAVGVAAAVNFLESLIDFKLDPFTDAMAVFAIIGAFLCLGVVAGWPSHVDQALSKLDHSSGSVTWLFGLGVAVVSISLLSICQCRRSKDQSKYKGA